MMQCSDSKAAPKVSVLIPTFNRPQYLAEALGSVLRQSYGNLQVIVINDGGQDVSSIVASFNDGRIVFLNRRENRGKAFSLNEAISHAEGRYIAYLDDDDLFYPHHIEMLVNVLENRTDCQVAYSDLYKVYCRIHPDGSRRALSKVVEVSRDFDRFFMLYFNHVLHVSLMHRADLIEKTGPYNESLDVMIDWDMTRRLVFFSDFHHVRQVTGEFYHPAGDSDRISVKQRRDPAEYARNVLTIRTTRPPKPWPKVQDLSIILIAGQFDKNAGNTVGCIWRHTFYPYKLYLPLPAVDMSRLKTDMPNIVTVPVGAGDSQSQRLDAALACCEGEYVAVVPAGFPIRDMWLEDCLYALLNSAAQQEAYELEDSTGSLWAVVLKRQVLQQARGSFPHLPLPDSLKASGVTIRRLRPDQIPFQFDSLYKEALGAEKNGDWLRSAEIYEYVADNYGNELWMRALAANALFNGGCHARAAELCSVLNQQCPTVATLLLEAKLKNRQGRPESGIKLLTGAEEILSGNAGCHYSVCGNSRENIGTR